jgi:hypothetical protein
MKDIKQTKNNPTEIKICSDFFIAVSVSASPAQKREQSFCLRRGILFEEEKSG